MNDLQSYLDNALKKVNLDKSISHDTLDIYNIYDIYHEIAELIISTRVELGLTQGQLAHLTNVSQSNISKFENGITRPSITTLKKIADGIGKRLVISFSEKEDNI